MNILIDIGHPAHVHLFKNFAREMINRGHKIMFTCRDKEFEIVLLEHYGFEYKSFGKKYKSTAGKLLGMIIFDIKEFITGLKFKPDVLLSHGSIYAAHASFFLRKPHISFEDTFNFEQIRLYKPFTDAILIGSYGNPLSKDKKAIKYKGFHELAYLHPKWFKPDINVFKELDLNNNDKYIILRFVSWNASHDLGHDGLTLSDKLNIVKSLSNYAKVFISLESYLPEELEAYRLKINPEKMHDAIAFSSLLIGESSTMSEEAAMLGVPSIYFFNKGTIYTNYIENKYKLIYNYNESKIDIERGLAKAIEILTNNKEDNWSSKKDKLLRESIDVTSFYIWFIENYPESKKIMQENPGYQERFK